MRECADTIQRHLEMLVMGGNRGECRFDFGYTLGVDVSEKSEREMVIFGFNEAQVRLPRSKSLCYLRALFPDLVAYRNSYEETEFPLRSLPRGASLDVAHC